MMTKAESESLSSYNSEEEKHIEVDILQLATQLDDLSPLYYDPVLIIMFPTSRELRNIVQLCTRYIQHVTQGSRGVKTI